MNRLFIQAMRCQWGSCNPSTRNIRLNTQLACRPRTCLDDVVLHELAHLRVPDWPERRRLLNDLPLADPG